MKARDYVIYSKPMNPNSWDVDEHGSVWCPLWVQWLLIRYLRWRGWRVIGKPGMWNAQRRGEKP